MSDETDRPHALIELALHWFSRSETGEITLHPDAHSLLATLLAGCASPADLRVSLATLIQVGWLLDVKLGAPSAAAAFIAALDAAAREAAPVLERRDDREQTAMRALGLSSHKAPSANGRRRPDRVSLDILGRRFQNRIR